MASAKLSAGILMYRIQEGAVEVFLVHPGGPFWAKKDDGVWSIPKGEYADGEDPVAAARREFAEETGLTAEGELTPLAAIRQASGKVIRAWAMEGDCDAALCRSNCFSLEWPSRSGKMREFPEVDRAAWFPLEIAKVKLLKGQLGFVEQLVGLLDQRRGGGDLFSIS